MKQHTKTFLFLLSIVLLFLLGGYLFLAVYYQDGFGLNTWINGVYCTGKTVEEVNAELLSHENEPVIRITDEKENSYQLDLSKAGYSRDYLEPLEQYLEKQNPFFWMENLITHPRQALAPAVTLNEGELEKLWGEMPFVKEELQREKILEIRYTENGYVLYDGLKDRLDTQKAYQELLSVIEDGGKTLSLRERQCYYDLTPSTAQEQTLKLWEKIQKFQSRGIVYDMGAEKVSLDAAVMSGFLKTEDGLPVSGEDGALVIDEEAVKSFVKKLAQEYDTYGKERSFQSTRGDTVLVKGGTYGTRLDQKAEEKYLLEQLLSESSEKLHVPAYEKQGLFRGRDDIGNTYIEIDMTKQKLYYYEEGELLFETEVVTGNTGRKMGTPEGVNYVYNKQRDRILRGPGYASPVKYWMPVKGGIGIHDANWRSKFGGEIYKKNGSHGCINIPSDKMPELYDMVEIGTPVVMFY